MMKLPQYDTFKEEVQILINKTLSMEVEYNKIKEIIDKISAFVQTDGKPGGQ